jgi:outer membrane immunogenic protein
MQKLAGFCVAIAALLASAIGTASAQQDKVPSWSTWYIGPSFGWGWRSANSYPSEAYYNSLGVFFGQGYYGGGGAYSAPKQSKHDGPVAGLTFGYNYQAGPMVIGLEYDILHANIADRPKLSQVTYLIGDRLFGLPHTAGNFDPTDGDSNKWYGIARLRLGYAIQRWMVFGTAGAAYRFSYNAYDPYSVDSAGHVTTYAGINHTNTWGWIAGGGVEYIWSELISLKAEYLHMDFGNATYVDPIASSAVGSAVVYNYKRDADIVRGGINLRFNFAGLGGSY